LSRKKSLRRKKRFAEKKSIIKFSVSTSLECSLGLGVKYKVHTHMHRGSRDRSKITLHLIADVFAFFTPTHSPSLHTSLNFSNRTPILISTAWLIQAPPLNQPPTGLLLCITPALLQLMVAISHLFLGHPVPVKIMSAPQMSLLKAIVY
jgi:hypothetical protein